MNLYVWQCWQADGWSTIAAIIPGSEHYGPMVLISRRRDIAEGMRPLAVAHGRELKAEIRLAEYCLHDTLELHRVTT